MYCSKCGKQIDNNISFCPGCGNVINQNSSINIDSSKSFFSNITIDKVLIMLIILVVGVIVFSISYFFIQNQKSRVVMIYMVGSNLESQAGLATRDLRDLDYYKLKKHHTKVVLIAGGARSWRNNYIDVNETSIYTLEENGFVKNDIRNKVNMGSIDNLSYFLNYVYTNYKASKYDFIYWNHGGAVDGSEYDDLTDDNLQLVEMSQAFEKSPFKNHKLEVLSFRTCLNSTIEIASIYKNYAKYLVASEEITIGSKADSAIRFLNDVSITDTPIEYGKKQIKVYQEVVSNTCNYGSTQKTDNNYCVKSTYSITDLSKIDELIKEFDQFAIDLNADIENRYSEYSKIRSTMNQYASDEPVYDMVDLYDFVEKFSAYTTNESRFKKAFSKAVVYNWTNTDYSHGLSIYFPYNYNQFLQSYTDISVSTNYTSFINDFYNAKLGIKQNSYTNFAQSFGGVSKRDKEKKEIDFELELTQEQLDNMTRASYLVFVDTKDGNYKPIYSGKDVKVEGNKLKATIKDRLLKICDKEYEDGCMWLLSTEEEVTDNYIDIKAFLMLSNSSAGYPFVSATATIRIDDKHKNGYIKALYSNLDGKEKKGNNFSVFSQEGIKITDYNFVTVMSSSYRLLDENGNFNPDWANTSKGVLEGTINRTNMIKIKKQDFSDDSDYYIVFRVFDVANNEYDSKPIKVNG